jgi:hypothetical protein
VVEVIRYSYSLNRRDYSLDNLVTENPDVTRIIPYAVRIVLYGYSAVLEFLS